MSGHTPGLLPCPFCGGEAATYEGKYCSSVKCDNGHAIHEYKPTLAEAIAAWNTREGLNPEAVADVVAALEAMTDLAHGYAEYIAAVPSSELARHPYLPGVEGEINSARTALARIRGEG